MGLCTEGEALEWWKANRTMYANWEGVKEAIRQYYGDHYQQNKAYNCIVALKMTSRVQKYLHNINWLNVYAGVTNHHLINMILNGMPYSL